MNKQTLYILGGLALAGGVAYWLYQKNKAAAPKPTPVQATGSGNSTVSDVTGAINSATSAYDSISNLF
jgi:uncharacterized membrane protein YebE (DUF533 family)